MGEDTRKLSSYEIVGELARGGMGTVYIARRTRAAGFQRLFAIKVIHSHLSDDEELVRQFLDEARLASQLHHPNVVAVVDVGESSGRPFVVMDYIEGCSLEDLLSLSPDKRPPAELASIFNDFLLGLHAAHELRDDDGALLNLVHRDVSPQNVLVGIDGAARITDFGITEARGRLTFTPSDVRKGKLAYLAPEQLDDRPVDRRADLFSAGTMLWSSLTGEPLFQGSSDAATMRNLLELEIPAPSEVGLRPPPVFDEVCRIALQRDPENRYRSAAEMVDALRTAAQAGGALGSSSQVARWVQSLAGETLETRRAALRLTDPTVPVITGTEGAVPPAGAPVVPPPEPEPTEGRRRPTLALLLLVPLLGILLAVALAFGTGEPSTEPAPSLAGHPSDSTAAGLGDVEEPADGPLSADPGPADGLGATETRESLRADEETVADRPQVSPTDPSSPEQESPTNRPAVRSRARVGSLARARGTVAGPGATMATVQAPPQAGESSASGGSDGDMAGEATPADSTASQDATAESPGVENESDESFRDYDRNPYLRGQ